MRPIFCATTGTVLEIMLKKSVSLLWLLARWYQSLRRNLDGLHVSQSTVAAVNKLACLDIYKLMFTGLQAFSFRLRHIGLQSQA